MSASISTGEGNDSIVLTYSTADAINYSSSINGGNGEDSLTADFSGLTLTGDRGITNSNRVIYSISEFLYLNSSIEKFNLTGTSLNDNLSGFGLSDTLSGGAGDDTINGGEGDDIITGGVRFV